MKDQIDAYIGTLPVSDVIDIDVIARRGRRVRRRRTMVVGATSLALVAIGAFGVTQLRYDTTNFAPATIATAGKSPSAADENRLLHAVVAAMHKHAPQVTGVESLVRYIHAPVSHDRVPAKPGEFDEYNEYQWRGGVTSPTGTYSLHVTIGRVVHYDLTLEEYQKLTPSERELHEIDGVNPQRIQASNSEVSTNKPDGTRISIQVFDTALIDVLAPDPAGGGGMSSPFTKDQLIAISLEPDLKYPR